MANIYTFGESNEKAANTMESIRNFVAIITLIFTILGFYKTPWWYLAVVTFIIFLVLRKYTKEYIESAQSEVNLNYKFSTLPDDIYIFKYVPVMYNNRGYTIDLIVVTRRAIFTVWDERSLGHFEGSADSNVWKSYTKNRVQDRIFVFKLLREQTYHAAKQLQAEGIIAWVQGVIYFSNEDTIAKGTGKDTAVVAGFEEFSNYILNFQPRVRLDQATYDRAIESIMRRGKIRRVEL